MEKIELIIILLMTVVRVTMLVILEEKRVSVDSEDGFEDDNGGGLKAAHVLSLAIIIGCNDDSNRREVNQGS